MVAPKRPLAAPAGELVDALFKAEAVKRTSFELGFERGATRIELVNGLPDVELIDTVDTEADALDRISEASPDVLILDLHLREGSGFGVLRSLALSTRPRPKIIVLTNFGLSEYRRAAELFGVEVFLDKAREYFRLPSLLTDFAKQHAVQDPH